MDKKIPSAPVTGSGIGVDGQLRLSVCPSGTKLYLLKRDRWMVETQIFFAFIPTNHYAEATLGKAFPSTPVTGRGTGVDGQTRLRVYSSVTRLFPLKLDS